MANSRREKSADLIAANRIDRESLQADAAPIGVATALAVGEVFATTLPPGLLTTARWANLGTSASPPPAAGRTPLQLEYQLRSVPFGNGQLLIAVPQARVQPFRSALVRLSVGLVLVVVILTLGVVMTLVGRIVQPLAKLTRAAELVSRGQLARSRPLVAEFAERRDEIGGLARAQILATARLHTVVKASQRLARHIESNVDAIDGIAKAVTNGAARQEERLTEVTGTLEPLTRALIHTSQGLQDAHSIVTTLSLSSSAADQTQAILATAVRRAEALLNSKEKENIEPRAMRTASVLQQASVIAQAVADQREVFLKVRDSVSALRSCIDGALESQPMEQHHGQHAHRAATEIGRLAKLHAQDAAALRTSGELLRQDLTDLQKQLGSLDARSSEDAARLSVSEERLPTGERAIVEDPRRRAERPRSAQSHNGLGRRSLPGISSSQSLAAVPGQPPAAERRAPVPPSTHSGAGANPFSRSSGNFPKVSAAGDSVPSGTSLRTGYASSLSGGGLTPGKGAGGSATSLNGSSGNLRPVPAGSGRSLGPASNTSLNGSSGSIRPVPASSHRSLGPGPSGASGVSLSGSSGTLRPVTQAPHGGALRQPAHSAGDSGASARSLRPSSDGLSFPAATTSGQSLGSATSLRRK